MRPEGSAGIATLGSRRYVGGMWDRIGRLQFDFLVAQGLRPSHTLLDIGCGSLRAGVHFVRYLGADGYIGVDRHPELLDAGRRECAALGLEPPTLIATSDFAFDIGRTVDVALAHSLFTHLTPPAIALCMRNLRQVISDDGVCYATFFEGDSAHNPAQSHDHATFWYSRDEIAACAPGWRFEYVGDWGHPRGQMMARLLP